MRFLTALVVVAGISAETEPEGLRDRITARVKESLDRLPDYVCTQTVERFARSTDTKPWEKVDKILLEVGYVGQREIYSWPGDRQYSENQVADLVRRGTVGTGHFGLLARHIFLSNAATLTYKGTADLNGRPTYLYDFDVPPGKSGYRLRAGSGEAVVPFQGSFWVELESLDLARIEMQAYDIPEQIGLAQADNILDYARMRIGEVEFLLPGSSVLMTVTSEGDGYLNRMRLDECRQFRAESTVTFESSAGTAAIASEAPGPLPARTLIEIALEMDVEPARASLGDSIRGVLAKAVKDGERVLFAEGTPVAGRLVRLEKLAMPFPHYEIGFEFHSLDTGAGKVRFSATLEDAGSASGLIRQAKRMDPVFTKKRTSRFDILVRETQQGQGILHWDAKKDRVPRGFKMKWRVDDGRRGAPSPE